MSLNEWPISQSNSKQDFSDTHKDKYKIVTEY